MEKYELVAVLSSAPMTSFYFGLIFSFFSSPDVFVVLRNALVFSFFVFLLPSLYIVRLWKEKKTDLNVSNRVFRQFVYYPSILSYLVGAGVFYVLADKMMFSITFCYAMVTSSLALVNLKWKISAHAAGITGPLTALAYVSGLYVLPFHLVVVPVMWLRVKMKAHTPTQVMAGSVLAALVTLVTYYFIW